MATQLSPNRFGDIGLRQTLNQVLTGDFSSGERAALIRALGASVASPEGELITGYGSSSGLVLVASVEDFPKPNASGAIQLQDNFTYYVTKSVDLMGSHLVGGRNTVIIGNSSENCILTSTGLGPSQALLVSEWSLPCRHFAITADRAIDLDATGNDNQALDWFAVNFLNCTTIGRIANYSNVIMQTCGILNSQGWEFDGTIGTVGFSQTIFTSFNSGQSIITIPATATITRRFRIIYSAFVVTGTSVGINVSDSATIPTEGYILDTVNFSGNGTYLQGVQPESNKSLFLENKGINNSASVGFYTMNGNSTATVIGSAGVPVKAAGTTTLQPVTQKFTSPESNRATYTGAVSRQFKVSSVLSVTSGNNNQVGIYVAKNGTVIPESEVYITTSGTGRAEAAKVQVVTPLSENDYVEIWVENNTSPNNITVTDLSVIVEALN